MTNATALSWYVCEDKNILPGGFVCSQSTE